MTIAVSRVICRALHLQVTYDINQSALHIATVRCICYSTRSMPKDELMLQNIAKGTSGKKLGLAESITNGSATIFQQERK